MFCYCFLFSDTYNEEMNVSYNTSNDSIISPQCQRTAWKVNFEHLGWNNFIISPTEFMAYDCAGRCANYLEPNTTNHLNLLNVFQKRSCCCAPIKYQSIPIMYYDKFDNIVVKNYNDIVVFECGCRQIFDGMHQFVLKQSYFPVLYNSNLKIK